MVQGYQELFRSCHHSLLGSILTGRKTAEGRQKVTTLETDMAAWKSEWKERDKYITKMDLEGSVATKNFIAAYEKEQAKQYGIMKELQTEVSHLDKVELRLDNLERIVRARYPADPPKTP
jgi:hypothetical protein